MQAENQESPLEALQEIRSIMDRSARFITLSGWSGIWAGFTALVGAYIAWGWIQHPDYRYVGQGNEASLGYFDPFVNRFLLLAVSVLFVALAGGLYFTYRKTKREGHVLWNNASRQLVLHLFFPLFAGAIFSVTFIYYNCTMFVAPACLVFSGLALISGSRYTLSDVRYLGMLEVALGCAALYFPHNGLIFWAMGFGVLHILYGGIMWNKYEK